MTTNLDDLVTQIQIQFGLMYQVNYRHDIITHCLRLNRTRDESIALATVIINAADDEPDGITERFKAYLDSIIELRKTNWNDRRETLLCGLGILVDTYTSGQAFWDSLDPETKLEYYSAAASAAYSTLINNLESLEDDHE